MAELVKFIAENGMEVLKLSPWFFKISPDPQYPEIYCINYNQIKTKYDTKIVNSAKIINQARGIIIDLSDPKFPRILCLPFIRFFNLGESRASQIDLSTAKAVQKADGSLIKLFFHPYQKKWVPASRGLTYLPDNLLPTWQEAFANSKDKYGFSFESLDRECVYIFELVGPDNQIVVVYQEAALIHLGTRRMSDLSEIQADIGLPQPKQYDLGEITYEAAKELVKGFNGLENEGLILVDSEWNRVKVKSPSYVLLHHSKGDQVPINNLVTRGILTNEIDEIKSVNIKLIPTIDLYLYAFEKLLDQLNSNYINLEPNNKTNKEFAIAIQNYDSELYFPKLYFLIFNKKFSSFRDIFLETFDPGSKKTKELSNILKKIVESEP